MTTPDIQQAKEWVTYVNGQRDLYGDKSVEARAAARVIQSLPDQWIDAEKVRELIDTYKHARDGNAAGTEGWVMNHLVVRNLESLLAAADYAEQEQGNV